MLVTTKQPSCKVNNNYIYKISTEVKLKFRFLDNFFSSEPTVTDFGVTPVKTERVQVVKCRVVPIPIPVSEMPPILPKILASVSESTGVQAPIGYHVIY